VLTAALLAVITAQPSCDSVPAAPKIPMPTEFACPAGATASTTKTGIECIARDGKATGDTFALDGKTGLMVHPLGLSVAWADGVVSWFSQRPVGHKVAYESGRVQRVELYEGDELKCARHFTEGRLSKRYDLGKWTWLDAKGRVLEASAPLDKAELTQVLREHQAEVQLCYESRLHEVKGDFRGTVSLTIEIEAGHVTKTKVNEDTLHDPPVTDCVTARVQSWQFRPSSEGLEVTFPFVFKEGR
jgi:hypothetical protein